MAGDLVVSVVWGDSVAIELTAEGCSYNPDVMNDMVGQAGRLLKNALTEAKELMATQPVEEEAVAAVDEED